MSLQERKRNATFSTALECLFDSKVSKKVASASALWQEEQNQQEVYATSTSHNENNIITPLKEDDDNYVGDAEEDAHPGFLEKTIRLSVVGFGYQEGWVGPDTPLHPTIGTRVTLHRQPNNKVDENAIEVCCCGLRMGYLDAATAAKLALLVDTGSLRLDGAAEIVQCHPASFGIQIQVSYRPSNTLSQILSFFQARANPYNRVSRSLSQKCLQRSKTAPFVASNLAPPLPWNPLILDIKGAIGTLTIAAGDADLPPTWLTPYDRTQWAPLSEEEITAATQAGWPPSDHVLLRLGLAPSTHAEWYKEAAGLLPPSQWDVSGALDLLPHIQLPSLRQAQFARRTLDGGMHGVSNVWCDLFLNELRKTMHQDNFWCQRKPDALIRAFGGNYVLGQKREKLELLRGAPHTAFTKKITMAHNVVYMLIHLAPPAEPGFNTIVFGCNLRGPGFHYHSDAIPGFAAKNAPLLPRQPVVTTVFYESPTQDSGKEVVLWRPTHNFSAIVPTVTEGKEGFTRADDSYHAARALVTTHGMVHVQRAGLQDASVHGIFHTPGETAPRHGYRVAVTARITKADREDCLQPHLASYMATLGPLGDTTLPARPVLYSAADY